MVLVMRYHEWSLPPCVWHPDPNQYMRVFDMVEVELVSHSELEFFDADTVIDADGVMPDYLPRETSLALGVWEWARRIW